MLSAAVCPDISQYKKLATGQLSSPDKEDLLDHLGRCNACVDLVESLSGKDTLVDLIRQAQTLYGEPTGQTVARLVERLQGLRPSAEAPAKASAQVLACSGCGKRLKIKADLAGKKIKCPHCQAVISAPAAAQPAGEKVVPPAPVGAEALTIAPACSAVGGSPAGPGHTRVYGSPSKKGAVLETASHAGAGAGQSPPADTDKHLYDFLAPAQSPDELGRLGPYRVLKVLGAGGMGVVFQAEDPHLQRLVALKAMLPGLAASDSAKQRFLREARAAAGLKHDHIVSIYQVGEDRGAPFLAMEFLEGEPLDVQLHREGKLPLADLLRIGREIADGLAAAHERGLIHRDIKPANIWLEASLARKGGESRVKILDFGLARAATGEAHLTQSGAIVGTPAFMAPEQATGKAVDPRSDLFSLGCVFYRMATGENPFRGTDMISTLMAVATKNPAPPVSLNFELPTELSDFIMQMLAKKPEERPESAQAVVETLDRIARDEQSPKPAKAGAWPEIAKASARPEKAKAPTPRAGRRIAVAVCALALLVPLGYWLSGIIIRVESKEGTLVIKTDDPGVSVKVTPDGGATVTYGKDRREIQLKPGKYGIELADAKDGLNLSTTQFTISDGENKVVEVLWEKKTAMKPADPKVEPKAESKLVPVPDPTARNPGEVVEVEIANGVKMKFCWVPAGNATLGSPNTEKDRRTNETEHEFTTKGFWLGKYAVTQQEWAAVLGKNPSGFSKESGGKNKVVGQETSRFPVECVSWHDCQDFLEKVNRTVKLPATMGNGKFALPHEDEWEYACRGGKGNKQPFYFGDILNGEQANCNGNFPYGTTTKGPYLERPTVVGSYEKIAPHPWGLCDMHGNVWQWCANWHDIAPKLRARRGGAWGFNSWYCRSAFRGFGSPVFADSSNLGFRVVVSQD